MNYENVYKLYFEASQILLGYKDEDDKVKQFLPQLHTSLTHLRQSLSCYVCYQLLTEPHSAVGSDCQHYLCRKCIGDDPKKDTSCFVPDEQLELLMDCYGSLCKCILSLQTFSCQKQKNSCPPATHKNIRGIFGISKEAVMHTGKVTLDDNPEPAVPLPPAGSSKKAESSRCSRGRKKRRVLSQKKANLKQHPKKEVKASKKLTETQMAAKRVIKSHVAREDRKQIVTRSTVQLRSRQLPRRSRT